LAGFATKKPFHDYINRNVHKLGHDVWLSTNGIALFDDQGNLLGYRGADMDITEWKRAEEVLRESEERYRLIVEAVPMLAWRCDAAGLIIDANNRWLEYTGQSQDAVRGTGWTAALHPDDRAHALRQVNTGLASGSVQAEGRVRRATDGQYRWHLARALPVKDAHGKIVAWFGCAADTEDQKRAEEALRQTNEQLEQKILERTAKLRSLAAEMTKAEHRERRRIAHLLHEDLQQRLVAMKYRTESLLHSAGGGAVAETAKHLTDALDESIQLTRTLTTSLAPPVLYELGLRPLLEWLAGDVERQCGLAVRVTGQKAIHLSSDEMQAFAADAVRELLLNVSKHSGVKSAEIRITPTGKKRVTVEVRDKGKGVTNSHNQTEHFGLFSIRERAEAIGIGFDISSHPGKGTCATLTLATV